MNHDLFGTVVVELDYDNLRMVLDGLIRIRKQHSPGGKYRVQCDRLYDRLSAKLNQREGEIRDGID